MKPEHRKFLSKYGSEKHIDQLLSDKNNHDKEEVLDNPLVNDKHHERLFDEGYLIRNKMHVAKSHGLPEYMRSKVMKHENPVVRGAFAGRDDLRDEEFQHMKHDKNENIIHSLVGNPYSRAISTMARTDDRISDIINHGPDSARRVVSKFRDLADNHISDILKSGDTPSIAHVAHFADLNSDHLKTLVEHPDWQVRSNLAINDKTPDHILDKLSKDKDENVSVIASSYKANRQKRGY